MPRGPEIPEHITGREVPKEFRAELRALSKEAAEAVSKHFAAAAELLTDDPELAHAHARAGAQRGSRVAAVREAAGVIAYQLDLYDEAARELRTHRRISGSNENLPLIADAERGRGRPAKAIELFEESDEATLGSDLYTELLMVAAGAHIDLGRIPAARRLLETRPFNGSANGTLVRLLSVYSDVIRLEGDSDLADRYEELARRTARATGTLFGDEEIDPNADVEIVTIEEIELDDDTADNGAAAERSADEDSAEEASDDRSARTAVPTTASAAEEGLTISDEPQGDDQRGEDQSDDRSYDESAAADEDVADGHDAHEADFSDIDAEFDSEIVDELDEILAGEDDEAADDPRRTDD